ncbi:hypothetical protein BAE44_0003446 [Dichanthelium oligosanthes]|uniref:DUF7731 domain-containing protein n=1 Tax=Dichanthelium oligosanthes TaxID=888268 RepID=A0A1E5WDR8_9POAL|nr:hypothetical protein BAE44_0003446 [Dichanthelium oligosanthes]
MGDLSARHSRRWCGHFAAVLCLCAIFCKPGARSPSIISAVNPHQNSTSHMYIRGRHSLPLTERQVHAQINQSNMADAVPMDPLPNLLPARSLQCFEDGQVYSCCEGAYRLNPSGIIAVPIGAVDHYCGGACVVETEDVLNCVASALDGFAFYNGASVEDVRYALRRGCSHTVRRGDFNDLEPHLGDYPDIYGDDDEGSGGSEVKAPLKLLAFLGGAWLFLLGP